MLEPCRGPVETGNIGVESVGYTGVEPLLQRLYVRLAEESKTISWVPKSVINAAYSPHSERVILVERQRNKNINREVDQSLIIS